MIVYRIFDKTSGGRYNGVAPLLQLKQIHGSAVVDADKLIDFSVESEADAAVTTRLNLALSIKTADCVPVLLYDAQHGVIAAAHCGWRSAKANILANVVSLMRKKGAVDIHAIIGPAIHQPNYEVDQAFYEAILAEEPSASHLFQPHYYFDLPGFILLKLTSLSIATILDHCEDTYTNPVKYYSYRREKDTGRMLSTIMLSR